MQFASFPIIRTHRAGWLVIFSQALCALALSSGCGSSSSPLADNPPAGGADAAQPEGGDEPSASDAPPDQAEADAGTVQDAAEEAVTTDAADEPDAETPVADPEQPGPYTYQESDFMAGTTGVHCALPQAGPASAPYPAVLFAHGFLIESFRYYSYVRHLASFGYVACTVDYGSFQGQDQDPVTLSAALDWLLQQSAGSSGELAGKVDASKLGVMGHSRGGKAAANAALQDARFKALLGVDPVNTCPMGSCPDAIAAMPGLTIPSAFLGETTDGTSSGLGQACAPAADNFTQFFAKAPSPSILVDVLGANHMSFVDDTTGCLQCGFCKPATADRTVVLGIAHAYTAAFFERYLRGLAGYDAYLTGATAQQRYVQTGLAALDAK
jgi:predicted dienelactone hydrolase